MIGSREQQPAGEALAVEEWLARLGALLPPGTLEELGSAEQAVLLELARIAAHRSQRMAAPISTYLVGVAFGSLPRGERLAAIRDVTSRMDAEGG